MIQENYLNMVCSDLSAKTKVEVC